MGVERAVRDSEAQHGWQITGSEFGWPAGGAAIEFADLVLERRGVEFLAVECKRHDAEWIFLRDAGERAETDRVCSRWRRQAPMMGGFTEEHGAWGEVSIFPRSPEAAYCVVARGGGATRRLLEDSAGRVSAATEAIAQLLTATVNGPNDRTLHVVTSVLVTTARLSICDIPAEEIDLRTGRVDGSRVARREVEFIRFRKALGPMVKIRHGILQRLRDIHTANQRTVLVVAASHFVKLLQAWKFQWGPGLPMPWWMEGDSP
jgi:hypothetical protein